VIGVDHIFPLAPFQLFDLVGLDTSVEILRTLYEHRHEPACVPPPPMLRCMVTAGQPIRPSGEGFCDGCMVGAYR
jgi:3-hydroxybutyryl-CoA dehydrogenase